MDHNIDSAIIPNYCILPHNFESHNFKSKNYVLLYQKRFDSLDLKDKTTTLTTYVQELNVDRRIFLFAATTKTTNHTVSNKALIPIMDGLTKATTHTPKKQRTKHVISPTSGNKKSNNTGYATARDLFNESTTASIKDLLNNPTRDFHGKYDKDIHPNGKPAAILYSTDINPTAGTMSLSTADT